MKSSFLIRDGHPVLYLFFAGWGMDEQPFLPIAKLLEDGKLKLPVADLCILYDYTDLNLDLEQFKPYLEVRLWAWSMGVSAAAAVMPASGIKLTRTVAINGTELPVDDHIGIPQALFEGTLRALSERTLDKFNRRMCGDASLKTYFDQLKPNRSIESLRAELQAIGERSYRTGEMRWDEVIIGDNDAIFPFANQKNAWKGANITITEDAHYAKWIPFYEPRITINKKQVASRFGKAQHTYENQAVAQRTICNELRRLLQRYSGEDRKRILEIGAGSGMFTRELIELFKPMELVANDISDVSELLVERVGFSGFKFISGDAEQVELGVGFDLVASASTIQWFVSPGEFFAKVSESLKSGGILAISSFLPGNLREIRELTGISLEYPEMHDLIDLLQKHYELLHVSNDELTLYFERPVDVLRHLKETGVTGISDFKWTPSKLTNFTNAYVKEFSDGDKVKLTYHPVYLIAKKR